MLSSQALQDVVLREMADPVSGRRRGLSIVDLTDGSEILSHHPNTPRLMASTTKMFTAGAALTGLGRDSTVSTRLFAPGTPDAEGVLDSDLYVVGGGDPTLGDPEHVDKTYDGNGTSVDRLVDAVRAAGIREIRGRVIGDGTLFGSAAGFSGRVAALTYNRARTETPVLFAAEKFTESLQANGIAVAHPAAEGTQSSGSRLVGAVDSPPMLDLLTKSGHESDNFIAETVTKLIAAQKHKEASTPTGSATIQEHAAGYGSTIEIANGSGLGQGNICTPTALTTFLTSMRGSEYFDDFQRTLPQAGADGTLRERMRTTVASESVWAKTGTLNRYRKPLQDSLAGYVFGRSRTVAFSIVREKAESRFAARSSIDRMTDAIAHYCHDRRR